MIRLFQVPLQWGSDLQTSQNFEWSKRSWVANGLDFEWDRKSGSPTIWNAVKWGIWNSNFKKFEFQMFPDFKWSDFISPLYLIIRSWPVFIIFIRHVKISWDSFFIFDIFCNVAFFLIEWRHVDGIASLKPVTPTLNYFCKKFKIWMGNLCRASKVTGIIYYKSHMHGIWNLKHDELPGHMPNLAQLQGPESKLRLSWVE